jgi:hypothetical protein
MPNLLSAEEIERLDKLLDVLYEPIEDEEDPLKHLREWYVETYGVENDEERVVQVR